MAKFEVVDGEPVVILSAQDAGAALLVRMWAEMYRAEKMEAGQWVNGAIATYCGALDWAETMRVFAYNRRNHGPDISGKSGKSVGNGGGERS